MKIWNADSKGVDVVLDLWEGKKQAKYQTKISKNRDVFWKKKIGEIPHGFHGTSGWKKMFLKGNKGMVQNPGWPECDI